ncbi:MAG: heavy-metal-associated domain-containing protein [Thioalkalispiraceae bacterium]|jgi:copper chaperone CopZ
MDTLEIQASNIKCGGCVSNIQNGLKNIEGITVVNVDIPSNKIIIEGERLDKTVIQTKLAELGYPAVE